MRTRERVTDFGEVFTPPQLVDDMLNLVRDESYRIDSRFLEPACGSGNFLVAVLDRKLQSVEIRYGRSEFERRHYALFALMNTYGIELLPDNAEECRENLVNIVITYLGVQVESEWARAARVVAEANVVQGDALSMTTPDGIPIQFPEWGYLGKGKFQRRDFRYDNLTQRASFDGTLFGELDETDLFTPTKSYVAMTVRQIADLEGK